ncbi:MAG: DUF5110 domain-containing protein [Desulfomicrobium escambiense]|nr:DUF5110 domain-containing protein [Desulfomicrobium escambiense]
MHSTSNKFAVREPWRHAPGVRAVVGAFLRLRHQLVPYIYTAARLDSEVGTTDGLAAVLYRAGTGEGVRSGRRLHVRQRTGRRASSPTRSIRARNARRPSSICPRGCGPTSSPTRSTQAERPSASIVRLEHQNVFVKEGGIVVLAADPMTPADRNPDALEVRVYPGADNLYTLYEDDGDSSAYKGGDRHETRFVLVREGKKTILRIIPDKTPKGVCPDPPQLPRSRS